jgi:cation:H+ antiporter
MSKLFLEILIGIAIQVAGCELLTRATLSLTKNRRAYLATGGILLIGIALSFPLYYMAVQAATSGSPDLAAGLLIGGPLVKLLLLFGICATAANLSTEGWSRTAWTLTVASVLLAGFCYDGQIARWEGFAMLALLFTYILQIYQQQDNTPDFSIITKTTDCSWCAIAYLCVGFGVVMTGSDILIDGSVWYAKQFGSSEAATGATLVAAAASVPLMIACLVAISRKRTELVLPMLLGATFFHLLGGAGLVSAIRPLPIPLGSIKNDLILMPVASLIAAILVHMRKVVTSQEAALLIALFLAYSVYSFGL